VIGNAVKVMRIATGEEPEYYGDAPAKRETTIESARKGGLKGGKARALKLTIEQRAEIARDAAQARWKKS
jgi:hypothetical protein